VSAVIALFGLGMLVYPFVGHHYPGFVRVPIEKGIEWSNVFSDLQTNKIQSRLHTEFASRAAKPQPGPVKEGEPLTRLQIPKLGVDTIVVEGTSLSALKAGAGHYPETPLPGEPGNVGIAGHRTTFGRPFNRIDELKPGDQVILTTPVGIFTYEVSRNPWVTFPEDWSVVDKSSSAILTLTSCHPKGSANQRLIARAKLVKSEPSKAA
jgi:sortase A